MLASRAQNLVYLVTPYLLPAEQVLEIVTPVVPVRGASGSRAVGPAAEAVTALGNGLAQVSAVKGGKGSIADTFPHHLPPGKMLCATSQRLLFLLIIPQQRMAQLRWAVPRGLVRGVERRPRLQLLARFRLHFTDGSSVAVMTPRRADIDALAASLGRCDRKGAPVW